MNNNIWIYTKSGNWYKSNGNRTLQHTSRIVSDKKTFIPCKNVHELNVYVNTDEIECVTDFEMEDAINDSKNT